MPTRPGIAAHAHRSCGRARSAAAALLVLIHLGWRGIATEQATGVDGARPPLGGHGRASASSNRLFGALRGDCGVGVVIDAH